MSGGLAHLLSQAEPWLHAYGYVALAFCVMFEGVGIPLPGAILMGGAALLAGQGKMNLAAVILTAWSAAALGDNLGYWIGRAGGRRLLLKAGVKRRRMMKFEAFFRRFGIWLILFGRFFDGTRQLDGLVAGSARMPWPRFLIADAAGSGLWVAFWSFGLYTLDRHHALVHQLLLKINPWIAIPVLAMLAMLTFYLFSRGGPNDGTSHHSEMASTPSGSARDGKWQPPCIEVRRQS